jgi:hypothetical protein
MHQITTYVSAGFLSRHLAHGWYLNPRHKRNKKYRQTIPRIEHDGQFRGKRIEPIASPFF